MNSTPVDAYTFRARLQPALLATLPLAIAVTAFSPEGVTWWTPLWAAVIGCGGTYLLVELAREGGKRKEGALFSSWGGKPTTQLLRHRCAPNPVRLAGYHARLHQLRPDLVFPSPEEELENPEHADHVYEAAADYLKERTRDDKLVFQANCEYGFRRNTFGLKRYGVATSLLGFVAHVGILAAHHLLGIGVSLPTQLAAAAINGLLAGVWLLVVRSDWVKTTAFAYAERLLAAVDALRREELEPSRAAGSGSPRRASPAL